MKLSQKYLNRIIQTQLFDTLGDPPASLEGLNANDYTAVIYNQVVKIIQDLKNSGELKEGQNLDAGGITAQILLETGNGSSSLAAKYNNFGGIKDSPGWKGETIMIPNSDGDVNWRVYPSVEEGLKEQVRFYLPSKNPRYAKAGVLKAQNAAEHAKRVQAAGYAGEQTDYADRVLKLSNQISTRLKKANPEYSEEATYDYVYEPDEETSFSTSPIIFENTGAFRSTSNSAKLFLNNSNPPIKDNNNVFSNFNIEPTNANTKIQDNSFYNDNRSEEQLKQSNKVNKFLNAPIQYKNGGYIK